MIRWLFALVALLPFLVAAALSPPLSPPSQGGERGGEPAQPPGKEDPKSAEESFIQTPEGFAQPGRPAVAPGDQSGTLRVVVVDQETGKPAFCRVNVIGADGNFYEPRDNPLAPWSLQRTANRLGKGPFRYYGWFFYSPGEFRVQVPAGPVRVEVFKGFEFHAEKVSTQVIAGATREVQITLRRSADMTKLGYYSGDTHIHLSRTSDAEDQRALDLIAAEDLRFGCILCMNDPRTYTGTMNRQIWPQTNGFGPPSIRQRGPYTIVSGQEYRCGTYGHICLLMHKRLVLEETTVDPNNWPVFGQVGLETRQLGGYSFHAHGGYAREIYADFPQRVTDGVELLQFAEYRGIALQGWYRMLNVGYRFPAVGASDFPYCRAFGDCRTYVRVTGQPTAAEWVRNAALGRSFFTTGPLLLLEVEGHQPGEIIRKQGKGPHRLNVRVRLRCEVTPVTQLDLIVNGQAARRYTIRKHPAIDDWLEMSYEIEIAEPSWIAARAYSTPVNGQPDAEAHTNPVYVYFDGKAPYRQEDLDWLVERLDDQIAAQERRAFEERPNVLEFYRQSRAELVKLRDAAGQRVERP